MLAVRSDLSIDESEFEFQTSTSSGPGGQHVNRAETRVTLLFDVAHSPSLSDRQRARILQGLATRINKEGVLRVSSQKHRSQSANRDAAVGRFVELLNDALRQEKKRKRTKPTRASQKRRVDEKKQRGRIKKLRKPPQPD